MNTISSTIIPSEQAVRLIEQFFEKSSDKYLNLARSGSHMMNPYHNLIHELGAVYWTHSCAVNSSHNSARIDWPTQAALTLGPLFHDHNHSGGRTSDLENVKRALTFVRSQLDGSLSERTCAVVQGMIRCTEFTNGGFPIFPESFEAKCMRDADLMTIYSAEGRDLLVGLAFELGLDVRNLEDQSKFIEGNRAFLTKATMYTEFGKYMQATFLPDCLDKLEEHLGELTQNHVKLAINSIGDWTVSPGK